MTSSPWGLNHTDLSSECRQSESIYEGPEKSTDGERFVICATLDAGADMYFAGVHLIVYRHR